MPNRTFRDTTRSERINALSPFAEVFFYRLMMKADDFGNYTANVKLLKSDLFPLRSDGIADIEIVGWAEECMREGVVVLYESGGKLYLHIPEFNQTLRHGKKAKFPQFEGKAVEGRHLGAPAPQLAEKCHEIEIEIEVEREIETEVEAEGGAPEGASVLTSEKKEDEFEIFIERFNTITGRNFRGGKKEQGMLRARLKDFTMREICTAVMNCFNDKFHQENPNYLTPEFILRPDKLEKYLNYVRPVPGKESASAHANGHAAGKAEQVSRTNAEQLARRFGGARTD